MERDDRKLISDKIRQHMYVEFLESENAQLTEKNKTKVQDLTTQVDSLTASMSELTVSMKLSNDDLK